ncbi:RsmB/NOP family class I SAM-dependent RNA methyltransferase [Paracoccus sp. JM45]|uniref:RsmB/NOP family class I SAM-dependent RNA methyltransferase n=1 Tax=Paracoccus sp. JM45 TaxID=2283626 RepID=UPI000E6C697C|nr:RsmB/NOP family class I SAM-dependent RNA methyltransferase [Paracoccus sp. JM45]RJE80222.1 RsmB/NOP family class I SAM-dependent RNA methyltransferase [Paracoccus sp. JM45]
MTPAARVSAAISVLDQVLSGMPAEQALLRWSRGSRFAGSGDRAAVRDLVFGALRQRDSLAAIGGSLDGRGLMIGHARQTQQPLGSIFSGEGHAPQPLSADEAAVTPPADLPDDLPDWVRPQWEASLGDNARAVAAAMADRAPVWLRVNLALTDPVKAAQSLADEGILTEAFADLPSALRVTQNERLVGRSAAYRDGLVELQDLSPQLACASLPLRADDRVLDYCAGGGGKTLALAARQPKARFVAHDALPARMGDLPERAERSGAPVRIVRKPEGTFDLVVADVPCSGTGTWRRTPDAKWRLTPEQLTRLTEVQAEIIDQVARLIRVGGHLAYMTCSVLDSENAAQVAGFLERHPGFSLETDQSWTPLTAGDGFYMAVLVRNA